MQACCVNNVIKMQYPNLARQGSKSRAKGESRWTPTTPQESQTWDHLSSVVISSCFYGAVFSRAALIAQSVSCKGWGNILHVRSACVAAACQRTLLCSNLPNMSILSQGQSSRSPEVVCRRLQTVVHTSKWLVKYPYITEDIIPYLTAPALWTAGVVCWQ